MNRSALFASLLLLSGESGAAIPGHFQIVVDAPTVDWSVPATLCLEGICYQIQFFSDTGLTAADVSINGIPFVGWSSPCLGWYQCSGKVANAVRSLKRAVAARFPAVEYGAVYSDVKIKYFYYATRLNILYDKLP